MMVIAIETMQQQFDCHQRSCKAHITHSAAAAAAAAATIAAVMLC
jgi:hypothetical protein